jgi:hypothetical protein
VNAPAGVRKAALTAHVTASVGWLGGVLVTLALAVAVLVSPDAELVPAAYLVMDGVAGWLLVPLALAALLTGLLQSAITPWGLLRHYWVVVKLVLTLVATGVLLLYTRTLGTLAEQSADGGSALRSASPLVHTAGALVLLLGAVVLSVYKPRGLTRHGWRVQQQASPATR